MRVLQAFWDGGGNTAPQLAIARVLVERGHEVTFLGNACQREKVEATGAEFRAYRHAPDNDSSSPETDLLRDWEAKTPIGAFGRLRDRLMFGPALEFAHDVLEAAEAEPFDVVAWDYLLVGCGIGAEATGARSVAVIHTAYPVPTKGVPPFGLGLPIARGPLGRARDAALRPVFARMFKPGLEAANRVRAELGLSPQATPFDQLTGADLALVLTAPEFDFASEAALPANVRYTGPVLEETPAGNWDSPWEAGDERPLVLASFSTTYMDQGDLAERTVAALAELPVRGLVTTGPAIDAAGLQQAENVEVREFVPHAAVMPEASLAISHGGLGTVHAALGAGVPVICIPDGRDQDENAARAVHNGVGVRVGRSANADKIGRAVEEVLGDPAYKRSAERLAEAFAREDGAARAAEEIETLQT